MNVMVDTPHFAGALFRAIDAFGGTTLLQKLNRKHFVSYPHTAEHWVEWTVVSRLRGFSVVAVLLLGLSCRLSPLGGEGCVCPSLSPLSGGVDGSV